MLEVEEEEVVDGDAPEHGQEAARARGEEVGPVVCEGHAQAGELERQMRCMALLYQDQDAPVSSRPLPCPCRFGRRAAQ